MKKLKETVEDNTDRINSLEKEVNFLMSELNKIKSAKVVGKLELQKGGSNE